MKIDLSRLPREVKICLDTLVNNGIECYLVGGCVRDMVMGITPHDYDITVGCAPEIIKRIFDHTADTGIKHGTVTVIIDSMPIEITQFRYDGEYADHRHPENVSPSPDLLGDLSRRDFTVNALALSPDGALTDEFCGIDDINAKIIRAIGDPEKRFDEDALRIMRAFRFCSQLGFSMDDATYAAAVKLCDTLQFVSAERICAELIKTLAGERPEIIVKLIRAGGLRHVGLKECEDAEILRKIDDTITRAAALFILCGATPGEPESALKFSGDNMKKSTALQELYYEYKGRMPSDKPALKRIMSRYGYDICRSFLSLAAALGEDVQNTPKMCDEAADEPYLINHLALRGGDIAAMGFSGEQIGRVMDILLEKVMENPEKNDKKTLSDIALSLRI